jgi:hypothetical protein
MTSDFVLGLQTPNATEFFGAFLVLVGFCLVNVPREKQDEWLANCSAYSSWLKYKRVSVVSTDCQREELEQ